MNKFYSSVRNRVSFLLVTCLLFSCSSHSEENVSDAVCGLASPLLLNSDTIKFHLQDYIVDYSLVDTVLYAPGIKVLPGSKNEVITLGYSSELPPLSALKVILKDKREVDILLKKSTKIQAEIRLKDPHKKYKNVKARGEMNFWNAAVSEMKYVEGAWVEKFELAPGEYQYLLVVDDVEMLNPDNPDFVDNNLGGFNSLLRVGKYKQEDLPFIQSSGLSENSILFEASVGLHKVFAFWQNKVIEVSSYGKSFSVEIPNEARQLERSHIRVYAYNENGFSNDLLIPLSGGKVISDSEELTRFDHQNMIMYFMMVDRFRNGNKENDEPVDDPEILPQANFYGGDIQGIRDVIDEGYFDELGVNTIWLSPIVQNPKGAYGLFPDPHTSFSGYHGYWPVSSTKIDYRFGTSDDLKALVETAHGADKNIFLDYVANHVHELHPVYLQHPEWATNLYLPDGSLNTEKWDEYRLTTWFDTFLPTLDLRKPEVVDPMTDSALFWLTEYGIDGFRHDATKHIDELFWRQLTLKVKRLTDCDPPFYQIGETYGSPELINSYVSTGMLNGQFDFNLYDNAVAVFARDSESFVRLKNSLSQSLQVYGYHNLMGNITGNQDRARFISLAGGDVKFDEDMKMAGWKRDIGVGDQSGYAKLKLLHAFNLTIPGIPVIYYGDEYGMPGANDPDNRRWMQFENLSDEEETVLEVVQELTSLRSSNMSLLYGDLRFLVANNNELVYERTYLGQSAIVLFNKADAYTTLEIDAEIFSEGDIFPRFGSEISLSGNKILVELQPRSFEILIPE